MCGIFFYKGNKYSKEDLLSNFNKIINRGPDNSKLINIDNNIFGFHRLAINGLKKDSNQPLHHNNITLICNGEIFNHVHLIHKYDFLTTSSSDCEVILHLYHYLKIQGSSDVINELCNLLDGEFSFIIYDSVKSNTWFVHPAHYLIQEKYKDKKIFDTEIKPHIIYGQICIFPSFLEHFVAKAEEQSTTISGNLNIELKCGFNQK